VAHTIPRIGAVSNRTWSTTGEKERSTKPSRSKLTIYTSGQTAEPATTGYASKPGLFKSL
jgi:hypothetical protein